MKSFNFKTVFILCVILAAVICLLPTFFNCWPHKKINLGLDLQGGTHFSIETTLEKIPELQRNDAVERTLEVFRNRIDEIGVAGTTIQRQGDNRIIVQVPGVGTDESQRIKDILMRQAHLEFREVIDGPGEPVMIN